MENSIIQTQLGQVRGVRQTSVRGVKFFAFKGIPYAKPPVGELRFKDPEPAEPWPGIKNTTEFGSRCVQIDEIRKQIVGDEDCLYLNVYTNDLNPSSSRPVMVWIHGGSFICGSGEDDIYGPDYFIEKDIVLVTINYRLGIFGFLNVDDEDASGNQGLKDQVLALKWVRQNISRFGGDPNNVTIFGGSAGGASVHYLIISPLAQGLFHKAIMQSGVAINTWASAVHSPKETAIKLTSTLGKEITDSKQIIKFLRTIDTGRLVEAARSIRTLKDKSTCINPFTPSVDVKSKNPFLSIPVQEAAKTGVNVPCMVGHLSHDGLFFLTDMSAERYASIDADLENLLIHPTAKKFLQENNISVHDMKKVYIGDKNVGPEIAEKYAELVGAVHFFIGIHEMIEFQTKISKAPTYFYKFEYDSDIPMMQKIMNINAKGTCHGEELHYLFYPKVLKFIGTAAPAPGSTEYRISQRFVELWTNFAKTGNPTPQITGFIPVNWEPLENYLGEYNCLKISEDLKMIKVTNITREICRKKY